ncbi:hypothetical protein ACOSP7_011988 [Xanthoceras sorbifolium]
MEGKNNIKSDKLSRRYKYHSLTSSSRRCGQNSERVGGDKDTNLLHLRKFFTCFVDDQRRFQAPKETYS